MEPIEELRAQDPSHSDEWQGWRLEIVDASGRAGQMIPLIKWVMIRPLPSWASDQTPAIFCSHIPFMGCVLMSS
jgi:hypothetical protein